MLCSTASRFWPRPSAAALSDAAGRQNAHCFAPRALCAVMAKASCARVSKHAMYRCGASLSCGHTVRSSDACHCSANHAHCVRLLPNLLCPQCLHLRVHLRQQSSAAWVCLRGRSCAKHANSHCSASLLSWRRRSSERCGSASRTHMPVCAEMNLGRSHLLCTSRGPARMTCALTGSQRPTGCRATLAESSNTSKKRCHICGRISLSVPAALRRSWYSGAM